MALQVQQLDGYSKTRHERVQPCHSLRIACIESNECAKELRIVPGKSDLQHQSAFESVPLVEFMDLSFTCMPGEGSCRKLGSLLVQSVFRVQLTPI